MDLIGAGLGVAFAAWIGVVSIVAGGNPGPMVALALGSIAAAIAGARLAKMHFVAVPLIVAVAPILALLVHRSTILGGGVLGYSNASGSLSVVAACAAGTLALTVRSVALRFAAWILAAAWIFVPWLLGATAATALAALLPLAVVLFHNARMVRGLLIVGGGLTVIGLSTTIALASVGYRPTQEATSFNRWFDENLSEVRVVLWEQALDVISRDPLQGVGPTNFPDVSAPAVAPSDRMPAHNEYLQVAAEAGIPGGLLLLAIVAWGFLRLWPATVDSRSVPAILALSGVSLHANIDFVWHYAEVVLALGMLVGAGSVAQGAGLEHEAFPISTRTRRTVVASFALGILLLMPIEVVNPGRTVPNRATWIAERSGLRFPAPGVAHSVGPPRRLIDRLVAAQAFAIELRASPDILGQGGPARILSISDDTGHRNLTVGQEQDRLVFRLRTTQTDLNGLPQLEITNVFGSETQSHIVVSTTLDTTRVYLDGALRWSGPGPGGTLDNWSRDHLLLLGNETTGNRPWIGTVDWVAFYDRALDEDEVAGKVSAMGPESARPEARTAPPVALYRFEELSPSGFVDRSGVGLGPPLAVPAEIPAPDEGFLDTILGMAGTHPAVRLAVHSMLFGIWAMFMLMVARPRPAISHAGVVLIGGGTAVALVASVLRYLAGYHPTIPDLAGAALGCLVAVLLATGFRKPRRGNRPRST